MFNRMKTFVKNHWKKAIVGGVAVQVIAYGANYAANRFLAYHEARALDLWKKMKKDEHFSRMEETYLETYSSLLPSLKGSILLNLDSESITQLLKTGTGNNKVELWEELKLLAFSRVLVTIYGSSLLNVILRIQLSVIGGYLFIESNRAEQKHEWRNVNGIVLSNNTAIDKDLQHKYLSLANHLVQAGMEKLCAYIYAKTKEVVGSLSLKQKISINDLEQIFLNIVSKMERDPEATIPSEGNGSPAKYPWKYIFPLDVLEAHDFFRNNVQRCNPHYLPPDMYERLLCDTFDLLDSDDVTGLLGNFESQGISHFCDRVADCLASLSSETQVSQSVLANGSAAGHVGPSADHNHIFSEVQVPVAKMIPILNNLVEGRAQLSKTDPWVSLLVNSEGVRLLAANVYESFSTTTE